jgi:hypothetical protein
MSFHGGDRQRFCLFGRPGWRSPTPGEEPRIQTNALSWDRDRKQRDPSFRISQITWRTNVAHLLAEMSTTFESDADATLEFEATGWCF